MLALERNEGHCKKEDRVCGGELSASMIFFVVVGFVLLFSFSFFYFVRNSPQFHRLFRNLLHTLFCRPGWKFDSDIFLSFSVDNFG